MPATLHLPEIFCNFSDFHCLFSGLSVWHHKNSEHTQGHQWAWPFLITACLTGLILGSLLSQGLTLSPDPLFVMIGPVIIEIWPVLVMPQHFWGGAPSFPLDNFNNLPSKAIMSWIVTSVQPPATYQTLVQVNWSSSSQVGCHSLDASILGERIFKLWFQPWIKLNKPLIPMISLPLQS